MYDNESQRWVHCDCCEAQYDRPLTYEAGWGKKLTYVFGFSYDHVDDVIMRYTRKWNELKTRRDLLAEELLQNVLANLNAKISVRLFL